MHGNLRVSLAAILLAGAVAAGFFLPRTRAVDASRELPPVRPEPRPGRGHGAVCQFSDGPAIYLGRDLPAIEDYSSFEDWCRHRGGTIGWKP